MTAVFHWYGTAPDVSDWWNSRASGAAKIAAPSRRNQYVSEFKYLGQWAYNYDNTDDKEVLREVRIDLACVLYLLRLLCFARFVFIFM